MIAPKQVLELLEVRRPSHLAVVTVYEYLSEHYESHVTRVAEMLKARRDSGGDININELFVKMETDEDFDNERHWRFNLNKLNQLLNKYYLQNPNTKSISDIYKNLQ